MFTYLKQLHNNKKSSFSLVDNANIIWISWNFLIPSAVHNSLKVLRSQGYLEIFRFKVTYIQKGWHFHHIGFLPDWQLGSKKKLLAFFIIVWEGLHYQTLDLHITVRHCRTLSTKMHSALYKLCPVSPAFFVFLSKLFQSKLRFSGSKW